MSRKRPKNKAKVRSTSTSEVVSETANAEAIVEGEILAEGSGPNEVLEAAIDQAANEIAEQYAASSEGPDGDESSSDEVAAMADALEAVADQALPNLAVVEDSEGPGYLQTDLDAAASEELAAAGAPEGDETELAEGDAAALPTSAGSMEPGQLKLLVEALVFAADKPLTVQRLRQLTRIADTKKLEDTLLEIQADYSERGLILSSVSGGWQFRTRPQFSAWVQQLIAGRPVRLSRAQLETLAIVAYRQPITRPEIDDIRGVDSSATLKLLLDRALVRVLGKKEEVGRPMLYGTTKDFLDFFSLADLRELPTLREYSELTDESRQVITNKLGPSDDGTGGSGPGSSSGGDGGMGGDGPLGDGSDGETPADGAVASSFDASDDSNGLHVAADGETMHASGDSERAATDDEALSALTDDETVSASTDDEAMSALTDDETVSGVGDDDQASAVSDDTMSSAIGDEVMSVASDDDAASATPDGDPGAASLEDDTMSASLEDETVSEVADDEIESASTAATVGDDDPLSRLAARMLSSNLEPEAPDTELADGTGAVTASADDSEADALEAVADESAVEMTDDPSHFASGSRAFTAVTDADAVELAANVAAEMARDDEGESFVDESAAPGMLVATDEVVDDDLPAEPSE